MSLGVFAAALRGARASLDFVLMRRFARLDPPDVAATPRLVARRGADMTLEILWFCLIAVLWGGYFVLEGFDFGVGMLLPFLGRDEDDRSTMLETDRAASGTATRSGS